MAICRVGSPPLSVCDDGDDDTKEDDETWFSLASSFALACVSDRTSTLAARSDSSKFLCSPPPPLPLPPLPPSPTRRHLTPN